MSIIVGYFDEKKQLPEVTLKRMLAATYAPSAIDQCFWQTEILGLGVINQSSDVASVCGCTDTEKIVMTGTFESQSNNNSFPRLDKMDDESIALLRGGFVWVLMDEQKQRFFIANDHFARYPLYIARYRGAILFSSQIKALLAALPNTQSLDKSSVAMMLSVGELVGNQTLVAGIETLPAGNVLTIDAEGAHQHSYWQYRYQQDLSLNKQDAIQSVGEALTQSVQRAVENIDTVTVPLSGGLDSRFILDLANKSKQVHAYTWGVPDCRDLIYAKKAAQKINCPHDFFEFTPNYLEQYADKGVWITEGQLPVVNFHVLPYVNRLAGDGNLTLLDGFAGDAVLGGNFIKSEWLNNPSKNDVAERLWRWRLNSTVDLLQSSELRKAVLESKELFSEVYAQYTGETSMDSVMAFLMDNRVRRVTTGGTEIFRTQFSVKQPFMDVDLIMAINCVPHEWRKRHRFYLEVLNKFSPDMAAVAWQRTCLPMNIPYTFSWLSLATQKAYKEARKKIPLPDLMANDSPSQFGEWFKSDLKAYVEQILFSERTYDRAVLPMSTLEEAWQKHLAGKLDASSFLGAAISIELFARLFLDNLQGNIQRFAD